MKNVEMLSKIEKFSLGVFLCSMVLTAVLFLANIWSGTDNETLLKTTATFFVIGFANFLIWLPIVLYRLIGKFQR